MEGFRFLGFSIDFGFIFRLITGTDSLRGDLNPETPLSTPMLEAMPWSNYNVAEASDSSVLVHDSSMVRGAIW